MASVDFPAFVRDLKGAIGWKEPLPDCVTNETCDNCLEEFTADERKPRYTTCCISGKKSICSACVSAWSESERELKKDDNLFFEGSSCPYCRRVPLVAVENEYLLRELKQRFLYEELDKIKVTEEIKCCLCEQVSDKPNHQLVCMTCRGEVGEWLMSGNEEYRSVVKEGTYCIPCCYRHSLFHQKTKMETNEMRSLAQLIGYSKKQVEAVSDALLRRNKNEGYVRRSFCILYSLWLDVSGGKRIELLTMTRLMEVLNETKESLLARRQTVDEEDELREVAVSDFCAFLPGLAEDLDRWSSEIMNGCWNIVKDAEWAHSAAQLLSTSFEWMEALVPEVAEDCWSRLSEVIMHQLPSIVMRLSEQDDCRLRTMTLLYGTCQLVDRLMEGKQMKEITLFKPPPV